MSISTSRKRTARLGLKGTAVALAAALTASLSPAAWADPAPLARAEATIAANGQSNPVVRPNPDELIVTSVTASPGPCSEVCSGGADRESGAALPHDPRPRWVAVPSLYSDVRTPPAVVRVLAHNAGFQWDDAGIGAAAALVAVGLGVAGARVASTARGPRTRGERATAQS